LPYLEMKNISKRFGEVVANDRIWFDVERGEVHTLLGENGAGKTTLMNILYGLYALDEGEIYLDGKAAEINSPQKAIEHHIGMIHQHFMLIPRLSVTENIILGLPSPHPPFLQIRQAEEEVEKIAKRYDLFVDPQAIVAQLPVGLQQRVEILRALYRKTDLLILDEPTSVLTPMEVTALFKIIRKLTQGGLGVIFISHKLNEVMAISDRITVLRKGRVVGSVSAKETDQGQLARMMVGKEFVSTLSKSSAKGGRKLLEVRKLRVEDREGAKPTLKDISFEIREGEILGIAGVDGNGQDELADAIAGLKPLNNGQIMINDTDVTHFSPRRRIESGLSYIPSDRQRVGLILEFSVAENLVLKSYRGPPFSALGILLSHKNIDTNAEKMIKEFDIKVSNGKVKVSFLSGGNQQKVILAREISCLPQVLIAMQPTRGLDVGSTKYIHERILEHRRKGGATLLISTELDEIIALSDRIAVIYEGEIMGILSGGAKVNLEQISLMMAGVKDKSPRTLDDESNG